MTTDHLLSLHWLTDSRQLITDPARSAFFAIRGDHHDGHRFIGELYARGVRHYVVEQAALTPERRAELAQYAGAHYVAVESSLRTLQTLAGRHRAGFSLPVVGITGSNGKTIVKEWLAQLLADDYVICKSPRSYNSQVGVPLSVRQLNAGHTLGIFEAGISRPHEMQALADVIRPTIGLFTNIGTAHDEGFRSRRQKVAEKLRLFTAANTLIYCRDYADIDEEIRLLLRAVNPGIRLVGWSRARNLPAGEPPDERSETTYYVDVVDDQLTIGERSGVATPGDASPGEPVLTVRLPFTDPASVENLTHCLVLMHTLGKLPNVVELTRRLARLRPVSMRLERKEGLYDSVLIDDSYNNDVAGLQLALNFQRQQSARGGRVVILSDVLQSGQPEAELYAQIGRLVAEPTADAPGRFVGIGPVISRHADQFPPGSRFYASTDQFLAEFPLESLRDSVVLVKGARAFGFEQIVQRLQRKAHGTVLAIDLDALTHNLNYYRERVGPQTRIMVMVKAFAYGSGSAEVAQWLQFHRVDYVAVAYADEGVALRQQGITLPIMVMNPAPETFAVLREHRLEPELYSPRILTQFLDYVARRGDARPGEARPGEASHPPDNWVNVHLKIDTGMHRLGFVEADLPNVVAQVRNQPAVRVASVFSHLVGADDAQFNAFSQAQFARFERATNVVETGLGYRPIRHLLNSAGIVRFPEYKLDMVRLGIGLYGVESSQLEPRSLRPVGTLRTVISQIKTVPAGESVGYGRRGRLPHNARIATLAIGYADGYDRRFGNGVGQVWVNGTACPTVGNVCMDMTMIDVTAAQAEEGDVVEIFGPNVAITDLAARIGTIPYELLTNVSERVKRVFYKE